MMKDRVRKIIWRIKLLLAVFVLLLLVPRVFAEGLDPYSHNPLNELQAEFKPSLLPSVLRANQTQRQELPDSAPQTPAMVTDADGNKLLYQDGKLLVKIDPKGNQTYYKNSLPIFERNYEGSVTRKYEYSGSRATVKNEFGETLGYQEFGLGGKLLKEYNKDNILVRSYIYDGGKTLNWIINEITKSKTKYGLYGAEYELSFNGSKIADYIRDNYGRLLWKLEYTADDEGNLIPGNKIIFDEAGRNPLYVLDNQGNVIATYEYGKFERLKSITDQYGNKKIYGTYGILEERDMYDNLLVSHNWEGTKHVSSFEYGIKQITYYKIGDLGESDVYEPDYVLNQFGMKVKDYIYFQEVKDMTPKQIQELLNITKEDANKVYQAVQSLIDLNKSLAGISFIAEFEMTGNENDGNAVYAYKMDIFNEYNKSQGSVVFNDPNPLPEASKGSEGVSEVPSPDNEDNGRHVGPPEETPPNVPPAIPDGQDDDDEPGRHVGPPEN